MRLSPQLCMVIGVLYVLATPFACGSSVRLLLHAARGLEAPASSAKTHSDFPKAANKPSSRSGLAKQFSDSGTYRPRQFCSHGSSQEFEREV